MAIDGAPYFDESIMAPGVKGAARGRGQQRVHAASVGLGNHRNDETVLGAPSASEDGMMSKS